jgi:hypothetical protein
VNEQIESSAAAVGDLESMLMLTFLSALVSKDAGFPGFKGSFAIGITGEEEPVWWRAVFSERGFSEFVDRRPENVDAWLLLSPDEARGMMTGTLADLPDDALMGNRTVIKKFVNRYLKRRSGISVRTGNAKKNRGSRR